MSLGDHVCTVMEDGQLTEWVDTEGMVALGLMSPRLEARQIIDWLVAKATEKGLPAWRPAEMMQSAEALVAAIQTRQVNQAVVAAGEVYVRLGRVGLASDVVRELRAGVWEIGRRVWARRGALDTSGDGDRAWTVYTRMHAALEALE